MKSDGTPWRPIVHIEDISRAFLAVLESEPATVCERGVQRRHHRAELPHQRARRDRGRGRARLPDRLRRGRRARHALLPRQLRQDPPGRCPGSSRSGTPRRARGSSTRPTRAGSLTLEEFEGPRYQRIAHIRKLIADGVIDAISGTSSRRRGRRRKRAADAACRRRLRGRLRRRRAAIPAGSAGCCRSSTSARCRSRTGWSARTSVGREPRYPLRLAYCPDCTLVQLLETPPPEELFGADYLYFSSFSPALLEHSRAERRGADRAARPRAGQPGGRAGEQRRLHAPKLRRARHSGARASSRRRSRPRRRAAGGVPTRSDFFTPRFARDAARRGAGRRSAHRQQRRRARRRPERFRRRHPRRS